MFTEEGVAVDCQDGEFEDGGHHGWMWYAVGGINKSVAIMLIYPHVT